MEKYGYYQGSCGSPPRWGAPGEAHPTMVSIEGSITLLSCRRLPTIPRGGEVEMLR